MGDPSHKYSVNGNQNNANLLDIQETLAKQSQEFFELKEVFSKFMIYQEKNKERSRSRYGEGSRKHRSSHHRSPSQNHDDYSSHHNIDYYKQNPRQHRHTSHHVHREPKIDLIFFHGSSNIDDCLTWEMKVEQIEHERRITLATLSFQALAMTWWTTYTKDIRLHDFPKIRYWNELRSALRKTYMPSY